MSPRTLAVSGALLIALAVPAAAQAAVTIDPLLKPCYVTAETDDGRVGEAIVVKAHGFTPERGRRHRLRRRGRATPACRPTPTASWACSSPVRVEAPFIKKGSRDFTLTLTEQGNPANTATVTGRRVALDVKRQAPAGAHGRAEIRFRGRGFTANEPVYAHYVYEGELRKTVRMARDPNTCGEWRKRARQIPVATRTRGIWTVQFDQLEAVRAGDRPDFPCVRRCSGSSSSAGVPG